MIPYKLFEDLFLLARAYSRLQSAHNELRLAQHHVHSALDPDLGLERRVLEMEMVGISLELAGHYFSQAI
jgi:hypothetical protein